MSSLWEDGNRFSAENFAAVIKISVGSRGNEMVLLQERAVIVQKPAGAGGSGIKQKQACLNLFLLYLL